MDLDEALAEPEVQPSSLAHLMRDYQIDAELAVETGWQNGHQTQMVTAATGTGKTVTFCAIARRELDRGGKVLVLCHMDELIEQARDKFTKISGVAAAKEKAAEKALLSDRVVVGSIQTMTRPNRLASWPKNHFQLVIMDECHMSLADSFARVLTYFREGGARILGLTATADRGDKQSLGQFYQNLAFDYPLLRAVHDGWLVRPMVQTIPLNIDIREVKAARTPDGSDFNVSQVGSIIEPFLGTLAAEIWKAASTRKVLVFLPSIDTAQKMAECMKAVGFSAGFVSGACTDRHHKIAKYRRGEYRAMTCAMLLSTGFDCDDIDTIVVLRPTKIRSLFVQCVGRATRPLTAIVPALSAAPDAEARKAIIAASAKPSMLILDPLWLYEKHDLTAPSCLVAKNEDEVKLLKGVQGDLIAAEAAVAKDFLDTLRKAVEKNRNRKASFIDPLTFAVAMDDANIADYNPETLWDCKEPTIEQIRALEENGVESTAVRWRGQADMILNVIRSRNDRGLCTVRQMNFLKKHGVDARLMDKESATKKTASIILGFKHRNFRH